MNTIELTTTKIGDPVTEFVEQESGEFAARRQAGRARELGTDIDDQRGSQGSKFIEID